MGERNKNNKEQEISSYTQQEDASLKISMQFFADELLPYLGIKGKVVAFAPTELVHLELQCKVEAGKAVTREELVPLVLCLLMEGSMSQKDRVKAAYKITRKVNTVAKEEIEKIEAVIYAMADKFLDSVSKEEILEEISMTELGQMMINKGKKEGLKEGIKENRLEIAKNLIGLLDEQVIAERTGLSLDAVKELKNNSTSKA